MHDYFSGMISMRNDGVNVPALARKFLGKGPSKVVMTLISVALILVGAVFTNTPAALVNTPILAGSAVSPTLFWIAVAVIFAYYFASTFFPSIKSSDASIRFSERSSSSLPWESSWESLRTSAPSTR